MPEDERWLPTLSNGHLGFTAFGDFVYMNGLFNGKGGLSHRAEIPNFSNIQMELCPKNSTDCTYTLNIQSGYFKIHYENEDFSATQLIYPHRFYNRAIVNQFYINRFNSKGNLISFNLYQFASRYCSRFHVFMLFPFYLHINFNFLKFT